MLATETSPQRFPVRTWLIALTGWMFDFYDLVLFSFLLLPIGRDLHLTDSQEAVLLGAALGASGVGGILFGYISDLYGRKRTLMWTVCLYSIGTALTACATGPLTMFLFRLLTGLGVGGEWAVGHALLAESTPGHFRSRAPALLRWANLLRLRPVVKQVFNLHFKNPRQRKGQRQTWIIFLGLDCIDSLPRNAHALSERGLRPISFAA